MPMALSQTRRRAATPTPLVRPLRRLLALPRVAVLRRPPPVGPLVLVELGRPARRVLGARHVAAEVGLVAAVAAPGCRTAYRARSRRASSNSRRATGMCWRPK